MSSSPREGPDPGAPAESNTCRPEAATHTHTHTHTHTPTTTHTTNTTHQTRAHARGEFRGFIHIQLANLFHLFSAFHVSAASLRSSLLLSSSSLLLSPLISCPLAPGLISCPPLSPPSLSPSLSS